MPVDKSNSAPSTGVESVERKSTVIGKPSSEAKPTVIGSPITIPSPVQPSVMGTKVDLGKQKPTAPTVVPTVIGKPSSEAKPTVIGSPITIPSPVQPSMMGTKVDLGKQKPTAPTVVPVSKPKVLEPRATYQASVMPGVIRKGLEVTLQDLEEMYPGTPRDILHQSLQILKDTFVETLNIVACSQWGQVAQEKYQILVKESLEISLGGETRDGTQHLSRMLNILEDLVSLFQVPGSKSLKFWGKKTITPWEKYLEYESELKTIKSHLEKILPALREQQNRIENINEQAQKVSSLTDAYIISARYIAHLLGTNDLAHHLINQGMSLTKIIAQVQGGIVLRNAHGRAIDTLADCIQEEVLVSLPGWIERFALLSQKPSMTLTDSYSLRQSLEDLVIKLK
jgi:hypothetical protein